MRTHHCCLTIIFESVPTTGGSGGDAAPNTNIWAHPEPQAVFGMNSNFVYGTNSSVACPLNFQVALGSNLAICINPTAFDALYGDESTFPAASGFHQILGSGLGGNMQFTMGTSANFVVGQIYDINLGPRRITLDLHNQTMLSPLTKGLALAIMLEVMVFVIAYGIIPDDDWRAGFLMIFQLATQCLLIALMDVQGLYAQMDFKAKSLFNDAFTTKVDTARTPADPPLSAGQADLGAGALTTFPIAMTAPQTSYGKAVGAVLAVMGIVVMLLLPVILEIVSEVKLHHPNDKKATGYDTF